MHQVDRGRPRGEGLGPGLAKAERPALIRTRTLKLVAGSDARWLELFESADIVSEGAPRAYEEGRRYYGSTDIVLPVAAERSEDDLASLARVVALDPHVRLRALRLARREAEQRASGPLERLEAEITVESRANGIALHVEVEGEVLPERRAFPRAPAADS